jgi:hypothetical protein
MNRPPHAAGSPARDTDAEALPGVLPPALLARLRSIAEAIFFGPRGAPPPARLDWLVAEAADFLTRAGARSRLVIRLSVFMVWVLAPLRIGRLRPLSRLPLPERVRALDHLERSRANPPLLAVKAFLSLLYYEHPDSQLEVGFDAGCAAPSPSLPHAREPR